ncbi:DsbE family thiol:disulfide interchange protein [Lacimicrobium alkaliphilum]|uniref:Disulfide bond formation protein DsbE n=1 Tax=Lacimicrobium alkaliphilum TaxID=1526571 RepID=A0A0U2QN95_9ALTE|nr:DsbE family thiol:disulfide interchange protein [Lacimicrobium alkaliphilum]ALS99035.1 disulfide bond formation protein DsbE [Lacimicrobium alkaliphilum]
MKKLTLFLLPLLLFLLISVFLLQGLFSDPRERQSSLLDRPVPEFSLPDVMDESTIYGPQVFKGEVTLLNVWGTWCVTCAYELPFLTELRQQGVRILGLYYEQDLDPDFGAKSLAQIRRDIDKKLSQLGNPYAFNIFDQQRSLSLDLGVTGAPETFLIDAQGRVRLHHIGDVNERVWQQKFLPLYHKLSDQELNVQESGL